MEKVLQGKSAVVTGGGDGIGRAIALAMAANGAKVVINDIGKDDKGAGLAAKVVEEIKKAGGTAVANSDSVATMEGGRSIVKDAVSNFGRIDILVNCAGNYKVGTILDMTEEDWDAVIAVHLKGHFSCTQAALKEMVPQKSGRIINISSTGAFNFIPGGNRSISYAAAKAGVQGITAAESGQLMEYGITVNAILPGAITKLFPFATTTAFGAKKREGPEYVAPLIVYLVSDQAQKVTGQYFYIAGGELCIFTRPMQLPGPHMFTRKLGQWTVEELNELVPSMLGID